MMHILDVSGADSSGHVQHLSILCRQDTPHRATRQYSPSLSLQIGDTVSGLAERVYDDGEWPELLPFLFECVQSNQPRQMESALRIFADLAGFIMPVLLPHVNVLREQLARCMSHQETDVKIAGLSATTSFIRELDEDSDRNKFQDLIPVMLQSVSSILSTEEQDSAEEALEAFIEIAEAHPTFLRRQLDVVVNNMLQV